jgi:hypothetical protein
VTTEPPMPPPPEANGADEPDPDAPGYGLETGAPRGVGGPPPAVGPSSGVPGVGPGITQGPAFPRPVQAAPENKLPGLLVLGGALAVIGGAFLPWLQASEAGTTLKVTGINAGTWGTILLGGLAAARGLAMIRPTPVKMQLGSPVIGGILIGVLLAFRWSDLQSAIKDVQARYPDAHVQVGIGFIICVAGAVAIVVGGLLAARPRTR